MLIFVSLSSCARIFLKIIGGKMPDVESFESIKTTGSEWGVEPDNIYLLKPTFVIQQMNVPSNEIALFDKNGFSIDLKKVGDDPRCGGNIYGLFKGLDTITYAQRDSSRLLLNEIDRAFNISTNVTPVLDHTSDYYIVFYWNCYMGKVRNKDEISDLKRAISENTQIKTQLILINSDMYEGVDWEKKLEEKKASKEQKAMN